MSDKVDIKGLDKAEVLAALHNGTRPMGMGFLRAQGDMTVEQAREFVGTGGDHERDYPGVHRHVSAGRLYFDYVAGRPLKVDITGDEFSPLLYDRDAGEGRAALVIAALRASKAEAA